MRSTLKITSAMKLVASSKLHKAQKAIEALRPYEDALERILAAASASPESSLAGAQDDGTAVRTEKASPSIVLAFASNSSMCGAFNATAAAKALEIGFGSDHEVEYWSFGKKMSDALRKAGRTPARDYSNVVAHPSFEAVAEIATELRGMYGAGEISGVTLVYNRFVSVGRHDVVAEDFFSSVNPSPAVLGGHPVVLSGSEGSAAEDYIIEPSARELLDAMVPQVLNTKLYAALLDSAASEHAARMIAMQAATDNAQDLLAELSLEYNKGRQQKITAEILDLAGATE